MTEAAIRLQKRISQAIGLKKNIVREVWDPELIYVECMHCGRPVLWKPGVSTSLILQAGVRPEQLDESCLILSKGCPACQQGKHLFETKVVRLTQSRRSKSELRDAHGWS